MNPNFTNFTMFSVSAIMSRSDEKQFYSQMPEPKEILESFDDNILPELQRLVKTYHQINIGIYSKRIAILNDLRNSIPNITEASLGRSVEFLNSLMK